MWKKKTINTQKMDHPETIVKQEDESITITNQTARVKRIIKIDVTNKGVNVEVNELQVPRNRKPAEIKKLSETEPEEQIHREIHGYPFSFPVKERI